MSETKVQRCGAVVWFDPVTGWADYCTLPLGHEGEQPKHSTDPNAERTNGFGFTSDGWHSHH